MSDRVDDRVMPPFPREYRASGVLLHVTSLPRHTASAMSGRPRSRGWIGFTRRQSWWQALPLGPTGYGDSPYQSLSSFAGNELLISPDALIEDECCGQRLRGLLILGRRRL